MNHLPLLAAMNNPKLVSWLTPIWLLGVGVILGLLLFLVIWGLAAGFSRIGPLGRLAADRARLFRLTTWMTAVLGVLGAVYLLLDPWGGPTVNGTGNTAGNVGGWVTWLVPAVILLWLGVLGCLLLVWRRTVEEMPLAIVEGVLWPVLVAAVFLTGFGFMGFFVAEQPTSILATLTRLQAVGTEVVEFTLPASSKKSAGDAETQKDDKGPAMQAQPVSFRVDEIRFLRIRTDQRIRVTRDESALDNFSQSVEVLPDEEFQTISLSTLLAGVSSGDRIKTLQFGNFASSEAQVTLEVRTGLVYPQVWVVPWTAISVVLFFLIYIVQRGSMPRISAVALSTYKSLIAQPVFVILLGGCALGLIIFVWIPYNTFGEDIKMLKNTGMTFIMVCCILMALWSASTSVSEEIEGRTALTVLSKPLTRRSFVLGKFVGITWTMALMFIVLGIVFALVVAYKPIFDAKETARLVPPWQVCFQEMMHVIPGLVLAFMETLVLAALSVAISTRLPLLANFTVCLSIYALGHLTPMIVQSAMGSFSIVRFFGQLIATIFPNLDHFNIQAAVAAGKAVPIEYLGWSLIYCLIYTVIALLLALVMFEDRDLA